MAGITNSPAHACLQRTRTALETLSLDPERFNHHPTLDTRPHDQGFGSPLDAWGSASVLSSLTSPTDSEHASLLRSDESDRMPRPARAPQPDESAAPHSHSAPLNQSAASSAQVVADSAADGPQAAPAAANSAQVDTGVPLPPPEEDKWRADFMAEWDRDDDDDDDDDEEDDDQLSQLPPYPSSTALDDSNQHAYRAAERGHEQKEAKGEAHSQQPRGPSPIPRLSSSDAAHLQPKAPTPWDEIYSDSEEGSHGSSGRGSTSPQHGPYAAPAREQEEVSSRQPDPPHYDADLFGTVLFASQAQVVEVPAATHHIYPVRSRVHHQGRLLVNRHSNKNASVSNQFDE